MPTPEVPMHCAEFESKLSGYLENELLPTEHAAMNAHVLRCPACAALLRETKSIVHEAALLPPLSPSRDLWSGISERIDAPVAAIAERTPSRGTPRTMRTFTLRQYAAAAAALVALSSGATYLVTRAIVLASSVPVATTVATNRTDSVGATVTDVHLTVRSPELASTPVGNALPATYSTGAVDVIYEREITSMRSIVNERMGDLDSATVVEIKRNLAIIDKAIADSRAALANDPHSGFLSTQLDRALAAKLATLRKVALL